MSFYRSFRARAARAGLHRPVGWLRNLGLDSTDVFLASHGRAGSTLLRFVLAEILSGIPSTFDTIQRISPEVGLQINAYPILPGGGRLIKTHEPYCRVYRRAIYLVRDVRDVILSGFARDAATGSIDPKRRNLDDWVLAFMQGKVERWGSWQSHVASWIDSPLAARGDLLVIRFEDMREDLESTVARCLDFLGSPAKPSVIQAAIHHNSIEKMRTKEQESKRMDKISGDGRQVNSGLIGRWRNTLSEKQLRIVDEYAGDTLAFFDYPNSNNHEVKHQTKTGDRRWDSANTRIRSAEMFCRNRLAKIPRVDLESPVPFLADRALRVRIEGRIANLFCWYHY